MGNLALILLVFAFVLAIIAGCFATTFSPAPRWHFGWLAVAFFFAAQLVGGLGQIFR